MIVLSCAVFMGNWYCYYVGRWPDNPATPLWSISIEEQFYLLFPLMAARTTPRMIYGFCLLLIAVANGCLIGYSVSHVGTEVKPWTNTAVEFEMFAAGILLAVILNHRVPSVSWQLRISLIAFAGIAWASVVYFCHIKGFVGSTSPLSQMSQCTRRKGAPQRGWGHGLLDE